MPESVLQSAAELLQQYYGRPRAARPVGEWLTLVEVVLQQGGTSKASADWSWNDEAPLRTPEETAAHSGPRLAELLEAAGHKTRHAGVLPALAEWWLRRFGAADGAADFQQRSLEAWQSELRAIPGVNWELADRILLLVGGLVAYPVDRGSIRIAVRHGWMDMSAEYDDWQSFYVRGVPEAGVALTDMAAWNRRLGREFCGRRPKCETCPLKSLLPERGPVALDTHD